MVDAPGHRHAEELQGVLAGLARVSLSGEQQDPRLSAQARGRDRARGRESFALFPSRGNRSFAFCRVRVDGSFWAKLLPGHQRCAVRADTWTARALLVSA